MQLLYLFINIVPSSLFPFFLLTIIFITLAMEKDILLLLLITQAIISDFAIFVIKVAMFQFST